MAEPENTEEKHESLVWLNLLGWLDTHKTETGFAGLGLLVIIFAVYTQDHLQARKEANANAAIFVLNQPRGDGAEIKVAATEYLKIAQQYQSTSVAERAMLLAAGQLFSENKYPEAKTRFEEFMSKYPTSDKTAVARLGVAACLDAQNQIDPAISGYEQIITSHPGVSEANQAKIAVSLLYESKRQPDKALKYYDELIRANPPTIWRTEASMRREELLSRNPQLTPGSPAALPAIPTPLINLTNAAPSPNTNPAARK